MRRHDAERYATQGYRKYKKGEEIRLVANGREEQERILRRLKLAGFRAGRPFRKAPERNQYCVPIYGREQVARFLRMVEKTETCQPPLSPRHDKGKSVRSRRIVSPGFCRTLNEGSPT